MRNPICYTCHAPATIDDYGTWLCDDCKLDQLIESSKPAPLHWTVVLHYPGGAQGVDDTTAPTRRAAIHNVAKEHQHGWTRATATEIY